MRVRLTANPWKMAIMILGTVSVLAAPRPASANYTITFKLTNTGVIATGAGEFTDQSILNAATESSNQTWTDPMVYPTDQALIVGGATNQYGISIPDSVLSGALALDTANSTGTQFITTNTNSSLYLGYGGGDTYGSSSDYAVAGILPAQIPNYTGTAYSLVLPSMYSGGLFQVSNSYVWPNVPTSFSEMGLIPGTYNFSVNTNIIGYDTGGESGKDVFTLQIGAPSESPVPEPTTGALLGVGLLCSLALALIRRKAIRT